MFLRMLPSKLLRIAAAVSGGLLSMRSCIFGIAFSMPSRICSTPIFLIGTPIATIAKIITITHGSHQLALRRISANVLLGATNVSTMRSPCESWPSAGTKSSGIIYLLAAMLRQGKCNPETVGRNTRFAAPNPAHPRKLSSPPACAKPPKHRINTGKTISQNRACYISQLATIKSALKTHNSRLNRRPPDANRAHKPLRSIALRSELSRTLAPQQKGRHFLTALRPKLATGNWKLAAGSSKLAAENQPPAAKPATNSLSRNILTAKPFRFNRLQEPFNREPNILKHLAKGNRNRRGGGGVLPRYAVCGPARSDTHTTSFPRPAKYVRIGLRNRKSLPLAGHRFVDCLQRRRHLPPVVPGHPRRRVVQDRIGEVFQAPRKRAAQPAKDVLNEEALRIGKLLFRADLQRLALAVQKHMPGAADELNIRVDIGREGVWVNPPRLERDESSVGKLHLGLDHVVGRNAAGNEHLLASPGARFDRLAVDEPAHQIDVMRREQPRAGRFASPSNVFGGHNDRVALARITGHRHTDVSRGDGVVRLLVRGEPAMVEGHLDLAAHLVRQPQQRVGLGGAGRKRLLAEHVTPGFEGSLDEFKVPVVGRCDDDGVDVVALQHLAVVAIAGHAVLRRNFVHHFLPPRADGSNPRQMALRKYPDTHAAHLPQANDCNANLIHDFQLSVLMLPSNIAASMIHPEGAKSYTAESFPCPRRRCAPSAHPPRCLRDQEPACRSRTQSVPLRRD